MSFEYQRHEERGIETGVCMSMRAEFEKWYSQEGEYSGLPLDCFDEDGDYVDDFVQSMWMAWQAARTQGSQGAEPIGWVHSKRLKELEAGHPIRVYHPDTPVVFDSKVPVYTQPQPAVPGEEIHVDVEGDDVYTLPLQPSVMGTPRFVVHVPAVSHLEWSQTLLDGETVTLSQAEEAVAKLGEGWRMSTRQELESLLDLSRHDPAIDTSRYPDAKSCAYWTGTPCAWNSDARWVVDFGGGFVDDYDRNDYACVLAVRDVEEGQGDE